MYQTSIYVTVPVSTPHHLWYFSFHRKQRSVKQARPLRVTMAPPPSKTKDRRRMTKEIEENRQLPYLDIMITRGEDKFRTKVYRKACATNQVPAFNSYTNPRYLRSAIRSDCIRAIRYCSSSKDRQQEFAFIRRKFHQYGYPLTLISTTLQKKNNCRSSTEGKSTASSCRHRRPSSTRPALCSLCWLLFLPTQAGCEQDRHSAGLQASDDHRISDM